MNKKRKYPKVDDGEPTAIRWRVQSMRFACCDCGLVHSFEFNVSEHGEIIEVTLFGQNRSTAQLRRQKSTNLQHGKVKRWALVRTEA